MICGKVRRLVCGSLWKITSICFALQCCNAFAIGPFGRIDVWPFPHSSGASANAAASADFDNDGDIDIAASYGSSVVWYKNKNGDSLTWWQGSSPLSTSVTTNYNCLTLFAGDVDGDGDSDLVGGCTSSGVSYVAWFENSSNGTTWTPHLVYQLSELIHWVEPADIDGDGDLDLAVAFYATLGWMELNSGSAVAWTTLDSSGFANFRCAHPANLDSDSELEILGVLHYGITLSRQVCIYQPAGTRTDLATTQISSPWSAWHGDFDGDGDNDVAAGTSSQTFIWRNDSGGTWTAITAPSGAGQLLRSGDFDGDGSDELVAGYTLRVLKYNGSTWSSTTVEPTMTPNLASTAGFDVADIDLDGDLDITGPGVAGVHWWGDGESSHFYNPYGGY